MNKPKSAEVKKTLVRNSEKPTPKTVTVSRSSQKCSMENSTSILEIPSKTALPNEKNLIKASKFNRPDLYSTLKLSKQIDDIVKPRKTKSLSDVKNKLALDEKVSRKVNFPYGQSVFKDLIPLSNNEAKPAPVQVIRGPILQKDQEPVLSDFLVARKSKAYYHLPNLAMKPFEQCPIINISPTNNLRLYKILQNDDSDQVFR